VAIANNCAQLEYLDISGALKITDNGIKNIFEKCKKLRGLELDHVDILTDDSIIQVSEYLNLETFSIVNNLLITDKSLCPIVTACTRLKTLNVSGCKQLTDEFIKHIKCTSLKSIDISWCTQISNYGLLELVKIVPNILSLNLYSCVIITEFDCVKEYCKQLKNFTTPRGY